MLLFGHVFLDAHLEDKVLSPILDDLNQRVVINIDAYSAADHHKNGLGTAPKYSEHLLNQIS